MGPDAAGSKLGQMLRIHSTLERVREQRAALVNWLAILGIPVWLIALRPGWPALEVRRLLLAAWAVSALFAVGFIVREWRWRARLDSEARRP